VCARGAYRALLSGPSTSPLDRRFSVSAETLAAQINAASTLKVGSLRFWGDWFGRPYDNFHRIRRCSARESTLFIEFEDGGKLTVVDPDCLSLSATTFEIRAASSVRWEWHYYGRPQIPENLCFFEYTRRGSEIYATTNVDWYTPTLSPSVDENAVEIL
jgi:hypothetical protein